MMFSTQSNALEVKYATIKYYAFMMMVLFLLKLFM